MKSNAIPRIGIFNLALIMMAYSAGVITDEWYFREVGGVSISSVLAFIASSFSAVPETISEIGAHKKFGYANLELKFHALYAIWLATTALQWYLIAKLCSYLVSRHQSKTLKNIGQISIVIGVIFFFYSLSTFNCSEFYGCTLQAKITQGISLLVIGMYFVNESKRLQL